MDLIRLGSWDLGLATGLVLLLALMSWRLRLGVGQRVLIAAARSTVQLVLFAEIFERIEVPHDHPGIGRIVLEFRQTFLRELIHSPFRIVYRPEGKQIRIIHIWRSEKMLHLAPEKTENGF